MINSLLFKNRASSPTLPYYYMAHIWEWNCSHYLAFNSNSTVCCLDHADIISTITWKMLLQYSALQRSYSPGLTVF